MGASRDMQGDLVDVELHGLGVGERQDQTRPDASCRTDGAEQIGRLVALVGRLAGPSAAPCPLPHDAVLLTDPSLVLEPDLDLLLARHARQMGSERAREVF